jgi:hypothetical protein
MAKALYSFKMRRCSKESAPRSGLPPPFIAARLCFALSPLSFAYDLDVANFNSGVVALNQKL